MSMAPLKKSVAQQMLEALLVSVVYYNKGFVRETRRSIVTFVKEASEDNSLELVSLGREERNLV